MSNLFSIPRLIDRMLSFCKTAYLRMRCFAVSCVLLSRMRHDPVYCGVLRRKWRNMLRVTARRRTAPHPVCKRTFTRCIVEMLRNAWCRTLRARKNSLGHFSDIWGDFTSFSQKINKSASILLMSQNWRCPLAAAVWHRQLSLAVFNAHLKTHLFSISCEATAHLWHLWFICAAYKCTYLLTYLLTLLPLSIKGTDRQAGRRQTVTIPFHRHSPLEMGSVKNTIALLLFH